MTFSSVCHSVFKPEHVISFGVMSCPIRGPTSVLAVHSGRCESNGELEVLHKGKIDAVCITLSSLRSQPDAGAGHLNSGVIHSVESVSKFVL